MRVLVVGAGRMGGHHARMLSRRPEVGEVLVADTHPERAASLALEVGGRAVLRDDARPGALDVAWVVVASPTSHHGEALHWARAGAHVLVEKPLAADLAAARELQHPRIRVGHIERHNPAFLHAAPGDGMDVHTRRVVERPPSDGAGRDVVSDLMLHDLDLLLRIATGPLFVHDVRGDRRHHVVADIHGNGIQATLEAGLTSHAQAGRTWEGSDGTGAFKVDFARRAAFRDGRPLTVPVHDALTEQWKAVVAGGGVPAEEALRSLELATAVLSRLPDGSDPLERTDAS